MILVIEDEHGLREHHVKQGTFVVGRQLSCHITTFSTGVSRKHISCTLRGDVLIIRDLGTTNGTLLNGELITQAKAVPGDRIQIGQVTITVKKEPPSPEAAPPPGVYVRDAFDVEKDAQYEEDSEPTPVDETFRAAGPVKGPTGQAAGVEKEGSTALVPVQRGELRLPAKTIESRPGRPWRTSRRFRLATVGLASLLVAGFAALAILKYRPRGPKPLGGREYNLYVDRIVELYRNDETEKAITLARQVKERKNTANFETATILLEAMSFDEKLKSDFEKNWEDAKTRWEELASGYDRATPTVKELAKERLVFIDREMDNMALFNEALDYYNRKKWKEYLETSLDVQEDSIFKSKLEEKTQLVKEEFVKVQLAAADLAGQQGDWQRAIRECEHMTRLASGVQSEVDSKLKEYKLCLGEKNRIASADKLLDQGKDKEAEQLIADIRADGPLGQQAKLREGRILTLRAERTARAAYDAGRAAEALKTLEEAGLEKDSLYDKISTVLKAWESAEAAAGRARFPLAMSLWQRIVRAETSEKNFYREQAQKRLVNWQEEAKKMALSLQRKGEDAYKNLEYAAAREFFEQARRIDPAGHMPSDSIDRLKREARTKYNHALNLKGEKPAEALKLLEEVSACLLRGEPYYIEASELIEELKKALKEEKAAPART